LPIIAELKSKTPEEYRNYFICVRLQDWSQALKHLAKVPERFDECLALIKQHSLYTDALSIFNKSDKYTVCLKLLVNLTLSCLGNLPNLRRSLADESAIPVGLYVL
jgi:hypothetical protein